MPHYDYTTVGHVTVDILAGEYVEQEGLGSAACGRPRHPPARRPGGTAFYSALQAARCGLRTHILTKGNPAEVETLLEPYRDELDLTVIPAEHTTTLQTVGEGLQRHQRLLAWAGPIEGPIAVDTAILHIAPVARETPGGRFDAHPPGADFVGLTPQGLVREWDATGEIALAPPRPEQLPEHCDAWVLSEREREWCAAPAARATAAGAVVAITAGAHPTELRLPGGRPLRVAPPITTVVDDLGAGDVFAAALFIALHEGQPPARAAAFAGAAAAVRVAGESPGAIGDRRAIAARLDRLRPPPRPAPDR